MKITFAALAVATACIAAPIVSAPVGHADVCGDVGGRHASVGGCTDVAGDIAVGTAIAADDDAAAQVSAGLPPCYTPTGMPYYTPAGQPCN